MSTYCYISIYCVRVLLLVVLTLLHVCVSTYTPYYCMYVCPHTAYYCMYVCPHTPTGVFIPLHACVSAYYFMRPHTTACMCARLYYMRPHSHACMCVRMHVCVSACMYVCPHACMCVRMHVCVSACMYVCPHACVCVRMHVCVSACMYVCPHTPTQLLPHAEPRLGHSSGVPRAPKLQLHLVTKPLLTKPYYMQNLDSAILQEYIARPLLLGTPFTCFTGTQVQILTLAAAIRRLQVRHARVCAGVVARTAPRPPLQ
jgi:hypothetical protein